MDEEKFEMEKQNQNTSIKEKFQKFKSGHEKGFRIGHYVADGVLAGAAIYFGIKLYKVTKTSKGKDVIISIQSDMLEEANSKIERLVERHELKDEIMNAVMSEDFRLGGSLGAQQMAYKRWDNATA